MKRLYIYLFIASAGWFSSCTTVDDLVEDNMLPPDTTSATPGTADLTKYVAIGNSLTAGFMDGSLFSQGQSNSYPAILAEQFELAGGGTFNQPDINSQNGFNSAVSDPGNGIILGRLFLDLSGDSPLPTPLDGELPEDFAGDRSQLNNFGVPGIQVGQLLTPATGTPNDPIENPLYTRFASDPGTSTILGDAIAAQPTFFTLWIGNNDVLGYAVSGATNSAIFTSEVDFTAQFGLVISELLGKTTATGLVADIPNVSDIPFFTTVPYNSIPFTEADSSTLDQLNDPVLGYGAYNAGLDALAAGMVITQEEADFRKVEFDTGANAIVILDSDLTDLTGFVPPGLEQVRQADEEDLILLTAGAVIGTLADTLDPNSAIGVSVALGDEYVLTEEEIEEIQMRTDAFNVIIAGEVNGSNRLTLFPANMIFEQIVLTGTTPGDVSLAPDFGPGGFFSVDGVHPNQRGYAIVANEMIDIINTTYSATIPTVNAFDFNGNLIVFQ